MTITRGREAGIQMANSIIEWSNLFYNNDTARRVLKAVILRLENHIKTIPPASRKRDGSRGGKP